VRWIVFSILGLMLLGLGGCAAMIEQVGVYPGSVLLPTGEPLPIADDVAAERLLLTSGDGTLLDAMYVAPPSPTAPVLLYSHGNGEVLSTQRWRFPYLRRLGCGILFYDYRGYGGSDGRPGEEGIHGDAEAAYRHLTEARGIAPERIILYGQSLGTGPTVALATRQPVGGVILEGAFTTIPDAARHFVGGSSLLTGLLLPLLETRFANIELIDRIDAPLLVLHARRDPIIPVSMGERLFEKARTPKQLHLFETANHGGVAWSLGDEYVAVVNQWIASLPALRLQMRFDRRDDASSPAMRATPSPATTPSPLMSP
jgi:pimeloyl-ACP methyl ester carboxylesterase